MRRPRATGELRASVAERDLEAELAFLRATVFLRTVDLPTQRITARERYSTNPLG